jgi:hypothetical protein
LKLITTLLLLAALVLAACSDQRSKARGEFLSGCVKSGGSKAACNCIFERLESKYGAEAIETLSSPMVNVTPDRMRPILDDTVRFGLACRNK